MEINSIREGNWRSRLVAVLQLATLREQDQQAGWMVPVELLNQSRQGLAQFEEEQNRNGRWSRWPSDNHMI